MNAEIAKIKLADSLRGMASKTVVARAMAKIEPFFDEMQALRDQNAALLRVLRARSSEPLPPPPREARLVDLD